jgi:uncharacterized protein with gpF-like domain
MPKNKKTPGPIPQEALDYFEAKDYQIGFDYRDVWKEEHVAAFTVAKVMRENILEAISEELDNSIQNGTTLKEFQENLTPFLQKKGWWGAKKMVDPKTGDVVKAQLGSPARLKLIYETNMNVAHSAGQWQRIERNIDVTPNLIYGLGPSKVHREVHVSWNGTILPATDPFWNTHFVPNGYGCLCTIRALTASQTEGLGGITARPDTTRIPWENKRTGEIEYVPIGIQPGWDYNPGKERLKNLDSK